MRLKLSHLLWLLITGCTLQYGASLSIANESCSGDKSACVTSINCCTSSTQGSTCQPCNGKGQWVWKNASLLGETFTDFTGRKFKFDDEMDQSYTLFTEADHQLNAIVSSANPRARQLGITMRGVGIHGPDTRVRLALAADDHVDLEINERTFRDDYLRLDGVTVTRGCPDDFPVNISCGDIVNVEDRFMKLTAWVVSVHAGEPVSLAFNLTIMDSPMSEIHGVLGQTLDAGDTKIAMPSNLQFYGEGPISGYSTSDLFSSDSVFSIFTRKMEERRKKRKRQMLEGNALASMAFAAKAESSALERVADRRKLPKLL